MAEIVNLRRQRKLRQREAKEAEAAANRAKFGRTKDLKALEESAGDLERRRLDAHRIDGE